MTERVNQHRARVTGRNTDRVPRELQTRSTPQERMQHGADLAVELLEGCDHAGITLVRGRELTAGPSTDGTVGRGDRLQYDLNEGPCLDAVRHSHTVYAADLTADGRWPAWGPAAHEELGVSSLLAVFLYTDERSYGALNLYSDRVDGFTDQDVVVAESLAAHLAVAMADGEEIEQRGQAMVSRTVIGQAEGILMERFGVAPDEAFAVLRRISQEVNRKLLDVASELVQTRVLPSRSQQ